MKFNQIFNVTAITTRNLLLGGNMISLSLARNPKQMINYISESLFLYKALNQRRGIPQKNVYEVLSAENVETVKLGSLKEGEAWFMSSASYTTDIINLCMICQIIKPKIVFEIGTMRGYTAFHFALNSPDDSKIYTLDLPKSEAVSHKLKTTVIDDVHVQSYLNSQKYQFEASDVASKINCLFSDSATFDFSPYYHKVDFFFIDGAHSYEYVKRDTMNALECCHPGSVIAWHDFGCVGVNGVSKLVIEMAEKYNIYSIPGGSVAFMVLE
ncbi:class I SAM-dependent methyltransferase [candidate division KSB1 bacterium]|nr:class I SAM-dependent methyltransferase [candidate division KSB1 bacterium]